MVCQWWKMAVVVAVPAAAVTVGYLTYRYYFSAEKVSNFKHFKNLFIRAMSMLSYFFNHLFSEGR